MTRVFTERPSFLSLIIKKGPFEENEKKEILQLSDIEGGLVALVEEEKTRFNCTIFLISTNTNAAAGIDGGRVPARRHFSLRAFSC